MRYLKYKHPKKEEKKIYKATLAALDKIERRALKKSNFLNKIAEAFFALLTVSLLLLSFYISKFFAPEYENLLQFLIFIPLYRFGIFALGAVITFIISALIAIPIFKSSSKFEERLKKLQREHLCEISSKAAEPVLKFYGLREPSITTKCYSSTDARFESKDVIIFESNGEIKIIRDFSSSLKLSEHDAGCYSFEKGEYSLSYTEYEGKRAVLLDSGEVKLTLSARAKPFIEKLEKYDKNGIFLPASKRRNGSSAYYEFSFCKKDLPIDELTRRGYTHWNEDSLLLYIDDDSRFFEHYMKYFENPHTPDGSGKFCYFGVNYYTAKEAARMLDEIEKDAPPYSAPLIIWLREAVNYNGFFFLGI